MGFFMQRHQAAVKIQSLVRRFLVRSKIGVKRVAWQRNRLLQCVVLIQRQVRLRELHCKCVCLQRYVLSFACGPNHPPGATVHRTTTRPATAGPAAFHALLELQGMSTRHVLLNS